jgi:hypothetical protein
MPEINPIAGGYSNSARPIVDEWSHLINRAILAKNRFNERADQIMSFFSGGPGAMWRPDFLTRFMGGTQAITAPKFKITSNIAYENVAIYLPLLYWEMARRKYVPSKSVNLDYRTLAAGNPEAEAFYEQIAQRQAMQDARKEMRSHLIEHILNYFQEEQPWGGLSSHSECALFEMLTKGCGFLRTEAYQYPFSDRTLVGSFFESVDDVLVDGDCTDPLWETANWIAIRHQTLVRDTEELFHMPEGMLDEYATVTSNNAAYLAAQGTPGPVKGSGHIVRNVIEWYEIFSRAGFGNRLAGKRSPPIDPAFDRARGQVRVGNQLVDDRFVYLCICKKCPYPLNLPAPFFDDMRADNEWVKVQTDWPTEYWRDNKWPVQMIYQHPHSGKSAWPEAMLSPALGEMACLNILMSGWIQQAYEGKQLVGAYWKGAIENIQDLKAGLSTWVEINPEFAAGMPGVAKGIDDVLSWLKRPELNASLPQAIEFVSQMVKRRTGLMDEMYGQNTGAEPRSAAAYEGKMNTVNIRPEYLQKRVAAWQSRVADSEVFCMYTHVDGARDLPEQLGPLGVAAYKTLITDEEPEHILHGSKAVVLASDIRRPNKSKDMADLQGLVQYLLPICSEYMFQNNKPGPLNQFIRAYEDAGEIDLNLQFPEPQPPDENAVAMQQAQLAEAQAKAEKLSADAQKSRADAQASAINGQAAQNDARMKMAVAEHGMRLKQQAAEHALDVKGQTAALANVAAKQKMLNFQDEHEQQMDARAAQAKQELAAKLWQNMQQLHQSAQTHVHERTIADDKASSDMQRANVIAEQRRLNMAADRQIRRQEASTNGATR